MVSFSLWVSWSRTTVALFLVATCSRMSSLAVVSPSTLSCRITKLSTDKSARPKKGACCLGRWGRCERGEDISFAFQLLVEEAA